MVNHVQWGKIVLHLNCDLFKRSYKMGREHHFDTCKEEPDQAKAMTVEQVLGLVAVPNAEGIYEFDDGGNQVEEILGFVLGYMSGPWMPETSDEYYERNYRYSKDTEPVLRAIEV